MKRGRLKKWAKWACTAAAAGVLGVAVASGFRAVRYAHGFTDRNLGVVLWISGGQITFNQWKAEGVVPLWPPDGWAMCEAGPWSWGMGDGRTGRDAWHGGVYWYSRKDWGEECDVGVTLLYPLVAFSLPAALLWYSDRRRAKPGACVGCGYDRSGIGLQVKCPECGTTPAGGSSPSPS